MSNKAQYVEVSLISGSQRIVANRVRIERFEAIEEVVEFRGDGLVRPVIREGYRVELTILRDESGNFYVEQFDD